jgi:nucleoside transporter
MSEPALTRTSPAILTRLSAMMFLQFFVWGAWYVTMGTFMGANGLGASIGHAYTVGPIAAIVSPFILGVIADRFFASQKVLGVLHLIGGLALLAAPSMAARAIELDKGSPLEAGAAAPFINPNHLGFLGVLLLHMLCYMPTLGLTNSVAFAHVRNAEKEFPIVRVLGTIGWIAAGIVVSKGLKAESTSVFFYAAGAAGIALGLYSFTLPNTPPPAAGKRVNVGELFGVDALRLMKSPSFAVFIVCSFLLCIPLAGYYGFAAGFAEKMGVAEVGFKMTFGQMSEIVFMLLMPLFFVRLGVKWMLAVGMLAWVVRYGLFAGAAGQSGDTALAMIIGGIILHGICYDFFFVTGFIYVDRVAPKEIRSQAQGFLVLVTQGLGLGVGAQVFAALTTRYTSGGVTDWASVWAFPAGMALVVLLVFVAAFRDGSRASK